MVEKEKYYIIFLLTIAIILRMVFAITTFNKTGTSNWSDDWYYLSMGKQISDGNWDPAIEGRPHMVVGPVIPMLTALFFLLFRDPLIPIFIYSIIVTSFTVVVLYYLGKELFGNLTGWFIAFWAVIFIEYMKYNAHILKEPSLFLFVPLTIFLLIRAVRNNYSLKYLFLSSLSFVVLVHTDERFIIYFPVFALTFFLVNPLIYKRFFKPVLIWISFVLLLMFPWGLRNYFVFDQIVILTPRTTVITSKFWGENLEAATSHFADESIRRKLNEGRYEEAVKFGSRYGIVPYEHEKNEAKVKAFFNFWQPTYFKPTFIQYGFRFQKWSFGHNMASLLFYGIFLPFYLVGILLLFKKRHIIGLIIASIPLIHSIMHAYMVWPLERYRSPITFIVVLISGFVLNEIVIRLKEKGLKN